MKLDSLLVPIDFSPASLDTLRYAVELAQLESKGEPPTLHLVHSCWVDPALAPETIKVFSELRNRLRDAAGRRLEKAEHPVREAGLRCESHLSELPPVDAICDTARRIGADLIVMSTHGSSGLDRLLVGSVTASTLRAAPCPVLALPAGSRSD